MSLLTGGIRWKFSLGATHASPLFFQQPALVTTFQELAALPTETTPFFPLVNHTKSPNVQIPSLRKFPAPSLFRPNALGGTFLARTLLQLEKRRQKLMSFLPH
jgi:hypothetical protein